MKLVLKKEESSGFRHFLQFDLKNNGNKIGFTQIRLKPSHRKELPDSFANHIFYEIKEKYRGRGYGKEILRLSLQEAKRRGLEEVVLTCHDDNFASKTIIERNGGKLVDDVIVPGENFATLKYLIKL